MNADAQHSDDQCKTAADYRQAADEHAQTLKDFWKRFLVSGLFVLAAIAVILASLAWFFSNNRVSAETSTLSAKADRFAITGVTGDGTQQGYYERNSTSEAERAAFGSNDSMTVSATVNLNNYNGGEIGPGSFGTIKFTVTPVATDLGDIKVDLQRAAQLRALDEQGNAVIQSTGTLCDLFRGHIQFFAGKDENGYYSNPLTSDTLTIQSSEFQDADGKTTQSATRTLYWVWPSQFQAFVLTGNVNYYQNLFASSDSDGYSALQKAINENHGYYYATLVDGEYVKPSTGDVPIASPDMTSTALEKCSLYYNYADEWLGSQAEYFQLRFSAQEVNN